MSNTSKAQQARMNNEAAVSALAKRVRKGTKAAIRELQDILINASGHGIKHETLTRIQGAFILGAPIAMADAIEATYTGKEDRQGRRGESSNLAWLMYIVDGKENPYSPSTRTKSKLSSEDKIWLRANRGNEWWGNAKNDDATNAEIKAASVAALNAFKNGAPAPAPAPMADADSVPFADKTAEQQEAMYQKFLASQS
jgi:hypothetical protein